MIIEYSREEVEEILLLNMPLYHKIKDKHWKDYNNPSGFVIELEDTIIGGKR